MMRPKAIATGATDTFIINKMNGTRRRKYIARKTAVTIDMVSTNQVSEVEFLEILGRFLENRMDTYWAEPLYVLENVIH